ncbi:MAG: type II secretion system F family protein [Phyllobacteriaceae bacterium]|jgi:tight adherence protein C|nr:type II secretion system F family protein [Phyllobacteriaceae bacterium]
MANLITSLLQIETLITLLVSLAAFGTVITITAPYLEGDKLKSRIKGVTEERDRLRLQLKAQLAGNDARLREKPKGGLYNQLVVALNLNKVFEGEASREMLRQAGYRAEKHLITFLALRAIVPVVVAILTFVYASTVFADRFSPSTRLLATIGALIVGFYVPGIGLKNLIHRRQASIKKAWSDALDLLLICVESGMALEPSMVRVAKEIGTQSVALAEEMSLTVAELSYLQDRRKALDNLGKRTGLETVRAVVTSLIQSERYGTPLGTALRVLAQENRDSRMSDAEKKAASLPPKLTVPMILFFLPVIFVVILGPSIILVMGLK